MTSTLWQKYRILWLHVFSLFHISNANLLYCIIGYYDYFWLKCGITLPFYSIQPKFGPKHIFSYLKYSELPKEWLKSPYNTRSESVPQCCGFTKRWALGCIKLLPGPAWLLLIETGPPFVHLCTLPHCPIELFLLLSPCDNYRILADLVPPSAGPNHLGSLRSGVGFP